MTFSFTTNPRLSEPIGFLCLIAAVAAALSLVSYYPLDPSPNSAGAAASAHNLVGMPGAYFSDMALQWLGLAAFLIPLYLTVFGWVRLRTLEVEWAKTRFTGALLLIVVVCAGLGLQSEWVFFQGAIRAGGVLGMVLADALVRFLNKTGAILFLISGAIVSLYLLTSFQLEDASEWLRRRSESKFRWSLPRLRIKLPSFRRNKPVDIPEVSPGRKTQRVAIVDKDVDQEEDAPAARAIAELPPIVPYSGAPVPDEVVAEDLEPPQFDSTKFDSKKVALDDAAPWDDDDLDLEEEDFEPEIVYRVPTTSLLHGPSARLAYDPEELQDTARRIAVKFDEFRVGGKVTQINPGPVVTTFEFKPDPGVKYSKIVNLSEDMCLALECESILVERIPGKSTVGIEVPNRHREVISLREIMESRDFRDAESPLTVAMGKDINGKLQVADLTSMPHLLVAGSTGSGKSVMVNAFVMSILLRATPQEVRFIMVDPKTVELGLYSDIPHLLTPVITDMKKASNALKNATREMERRLKLLAEHSVRNIDQFNKKIERMKERLEKEGNEDLARSLKRMPFIVIIIDELADLMMLEGRQIEESITRLAQMARAVGIHLVLATQRPSVDVITGLIKANIPARMSFRLATRVDSRTILDSMGAEALLGRGDMLFLPPGTARMKRLHGPFVTEDEIEAVVREWKAQGKPRYEIEYLATPDDEPDEAMDDAAAGFDDPKYKEAVQTVLQMGKASTSTLQRRLRIGYGRAASILDAMERDGIIGPPDGSRPRDVLKRPNWLDEVEDDE